MKSLLEKVLTDKKSRNKKQLTEVALRVNESMLDWS